MAKKKTETVVETPFYKYLWSFYQDNKKKIFKEYKDMTKKILSNANPENTNSFLRVPQYEAFEMYVFLKEYLDNPKLADLFSDWQNNKGKFKFENTKTIVYAGSDLFSMSDAVSFDESIKQLKEVQQCYANYIFSLTMGTGKTILMALCIFYEFLLAKKFPSDKRFCHNVLVLAPDTTVLQSLKEIQTFDKSRVFNEQYANQLEGMIHYHFLDEDGAPLQTADGSNFNIIISTNQKIILRKKHADEAAANMLFLDGWNESLKDDPNADLYTINDDTDLMANQRYTKLTRLQQLGIYVDEAHHAFGKDLKAHMLDRSKETSLRLTIDNLAKELETAGTSVIACYNFTGTPYVDNHLMPEVVYDYGLKAAIENKYLKEVDVIDYKNVKSNTFVKNAISLFLKANRSKNGEFKRYEGMLPKIAFFASTIDELTKELQPAVEKALISENISLDSILINVGDTSITKNDDEREFKLLDTPESEKQFILLVGKGKEGWNCRSLFGVALFREPKSKIFVLQSTMRCLRAITTTQQTGQVFLSEENLAILEEELRDNFRMSVSDLTKKTNLEKPERRIYIRKKVPVKVIEKIPQFKINALEVSNFTIFDKDFDEEKIIQTRAKRSIANIDGVASRENIESEDERVFTEYSLIAELSLFLTQHDNENNHKSLKYSPVEIRELLDKSTDGIEKILEYVNKSNDILYDFVIPKIFSKLYEVKYEEGEPREITKFIVKDPEDTDENGNPCYKMHFDDESFISDEASEFSEYNQKSGNKKSFDLSGYGFDSNSEKKFFVRNLINNNDIKHIWFTGMLTNGQGDFFVRYIDPESHALRSYYPDFLIEMKSGNFYIVEIKGENLIPIAETQAKVEYARHMFQNQNKMEYVFIPSQQADQILQQFLEAQKYQEIDMYHIKHSNGEILKVAKK